MLAHVFSFELRSRLRRPFTPVYFALFFGAGFFWMNLSAGAFAQASASFGGKVAANAPFALALSIAVLSYFTVLDVAATFGDAILKDVEHAMQPLLFTTRLSKRDYLFGRYLAGVVYLLLVNGSIGLGLFSASFMPWLDPSHLGPNRVLAYVQPYAIVVLPNLLTMGAFFLALAARLRRILPVYMAGVLLLIGYLIATSLAPDLDKQVLGSVLDPFGLTALSHLTEYWTVAERNTRIVPLTGVLLANRLGWLALGAIALAATYKQFSFHQPEERRAGLPDSAEAPSSAAPLTSPVRRDFSTVAWLRALPRLARREIRETIGNVYFGAILFAGLLFLLFASTQLGSLYGTPTYPVTYAVLELTAGTFSLFILIILTFYSGEILHRDREAGVADVLDASPAPTFVLHAAKLAALVAIIFMLLAIVLTAGLLIQVGHGFFRIEWSLYAKELFLIEAVEYLAIASITFTAQVLVGNKYVAYLVSILYFLFTWMAARLGLEHQLVRIGQMPSYRYSDMNGFGPFVAPLVAYGVTWSFFVLAIGVVRHLFYPRGRTFGTADTLRTARARLRGGGTAAALAIGLLGLGAGAGYVLYNTHVLRPYTTEFDRAELRATYERKYRAAFADLPQPTVTAAKLAVDFYPEERRARVHQHLEAENRSATAIDRILLTIDPNTFAVESLTPSLPARIDTDPRLGVRVVHLVEPLAPGARIAMDGVLVVAPRGFSNKDEVTSVVANGSFILSTGLLHLGYQDDAELTDDDERRKHGLAPKDRMRPMDDPRGLARNGFASDAEWIRFEATVSTSEDQLATAPGYLERTWTENGRRFFHYVLDAPILNIYGFQSARYAVRKDTWNGVDLEIDYHPTHDYNLDRMMRAAKASLEHFTTRFSPYQHHVLRIVEFPRYDDFAISLPNTVPYSESVGFIAKVDENDPKDVDYPFYITCHEVAHQWWAHQLTGADVRGVAVTSETLAQYSSLMVMKATFGRERMGRFLRYEMNRYLLGRSVERKKERPLALVEAQPYIYYQKGSVVMYALQDFLGEDRIDTALKKLLERRAFRGAPYVTSRDVEAAILDETPDELRYLVTDGFETITLYENRALSARTSKRSDGRYDVTLRVRTKKVRADELGAETDAPMNDLVEVAVLDARGGVLASERRRFRGGEEDVVLTVDAPPARAGIDPFNVLVDRAPDDNLLDVEGP